MPIVYRNQQLNQNNLNWYITLNDGTPVNVYSIEFEVKNIIDPQAPEILVNRTSATQFGTGSYYASFLVPQFQPTGTHKITWYWKFSLSSPEQVGHEEFEVLDPTIAPPPEAIITPQDLYDEGLSQSLYDVATIQNRIEFAQEYIERITGYFFEPRDLVLKLDGTGSDLLVFPIPIIEITKVQFSISTSGGLENQTLSNFMVYNRFYPDDRKYPRIRIHKTGNDSIFNRVGLKGSFPIGTQNIHVTGKFGYVESDLSTPKPIRFAMILLCLMLIDPMASSKTKKKLKGKGIKSENTDGHSYQLSEKMALGRLTGDPEIDSILVKYSKGSSVTGVV